MSKENSLKAEELNFHHPDGGWGWFIVLASGLSNLSTYPMLQQFGLVFKEKFEMLGFTETETTTITNMTTAFCAGIGLLNGPLFKRFTFRQVAMFSSCMVVISLLVCIYCKTFWSYLIFYSICYGSSFGSVQAANALALNSYFGKKRRLATGFSWTITALGPVVWPHVLVLLNNLYGIEGVLLIFSGIAMHSFAGALLLQPIEWHTLTKKFPSENETLLERGDSTKIQRKRSVISDAIYSFDVAGSSLIQSHRNKSKQSTHDLSEKWKSTKLLSEVLEHDTTNRERTTQPEILSTWKKISRFFDFELFKDPVYLNISVGITLANFVELNFSILTPIIMAEFNFVQNEIATFMSLLAATDIIVRFTIPFIADKIGWSNRIFFLIGVMSMAIGRIMHSQSYITALIVAVIIGFGKALRTIFIALVIPSHVPIDRLAAASGLQLAISGMVFVILGPIVGWTHRLVGNYVITLHLMNVLTYATTLSWIVENIVKNT